MTIDANAYDAVKIIVNSVRENVPTNYHKDIVEVVPIFKKDTIELSTVYINKDNFEEVSEKVHDEFRHFLKPKNPNSKPLYARK